jgi:zinc and cadmium transporter
LINYFLIIYCVIIALASVTGGWIPSRIKMTHVRIQLVISFVAGVMLGVAVLHLLPHSILVLPNIEWALGTMLAGILFMFFMNRMFHFHQHDFSSGEADETPYDAEHEAEMHAQDEKPCDHEHHHHRKQTSWLGLAFGMGVHTLIDGIALAAAVQSESATGFSLAGFGIFLAIALHKPLDAISIVSLMKAQHFSETKQTTINFLFAMICPIGALLFTFGLLQASEWQNWILGLTLAFSAGVFLCISLGDLLPEVHFHSHDRGKLSAALLLGILVAICIELLPGHDHQFRKNGINAKSKQSSVDQSNSD